VLLEIVNRKNLPMRWGKMLRVTQRSCFGAIGVFRALRKPINASGWRWMTTISYGLFGQHMSRRR